MPARNRLWQGVAVGLVLVCMTVIILLAANYGAGVDEHSCPAAIAGATIGCFLREYKELAAGLIATDGAIFAGWLAWSAVQRQIEEGAAKEKEARLILRSLLIGRILPVINQIWRAAELTFGIELSEELRRWRYRMAHEALRDLPGPAVIERLEALASEVNPVEREKIRPILAVLRDLFDRVEKGSNSDRGGEPPYFLDVRKRLSEMLEFLREFDPDAARIFADRESLSYDPVPIATRLADLIAKTDTGYWDDPC